METSDDLQIPIRTSREIRNEFLAGAIGGMAGLAVGHPFDTVKILMQNSRQQPTTTGVVYLIKQCGSVNFFRGLPIPFCSYALVNAVTFGVYKSSLKWLDPTERSMMACMAAGTMSSLAQLVPAVPIELIKTQQQCTAATSIEAPSVVHCVRSIWKHQGIRGLYTGTVAHAMRDVPGLTVYFMSYHQLFQGNQRLGMTPFWAAFTAGALSGALSWCVSLPFDIVKTRMQSGSLNTMSNVLKGLLSENSYAIFFRGFNVTVSRALLVNSCIFAVYETSYDWLCRRCHVAPLVLQIHVEPTG